MSADVLDVGASLKGLKDFQRRTVEYVFDRMYSDTKPARRFLVADEVGLGKTLVARGIVAKVVEKPTEEGQEADRYPLYMLQRNHRPAESESAECHGSKNIFVRDTPHAIAPGIAEPEGKRDQLYQLHSRNDV